MKMAVFEFSIVASGLDPVDDGFEARFLDHGCDDATISFQRGRIILDFAREAADFATALRSAMDAVRATGAKIVRVEPDPLVNLADIAERAGLTRAAVSLYASGQRGHNFPPPVMRVTADSPLWSWLEVARWLVQTDRLSGVALELAVALDEANQSLEISSLSNRFAA